MRAHDRLPWWSHIPFLLALASALGLIVSALMPWYVGDFDHTRYGPPASITLITVSTVVALVLMRRQSGWSWAPGVLVLAVAIMVLIGVEEQVVCPSDVEIEGNIAQACFTEEVTAGSVVFAVGAFGAAVASFIAPALIRRGAAVSWNRRRT